MTIKITDLYNDDVAEFKYLPEAYNYFMEYDEDCEGDWWPLVLIDGKMVPLEDFLEMCRKVGV